MKVNEWHNYRAVSPLKPGGTFEQRCSKGVRRYHDWLFHEGQAKPLQTSNFPTCLRTAWIAGPQPTPRGFDKRPNFSMTLFVQPGNTTNFLNYRSHHPLCADIINSRCVSKLTHWELLWEKNRNDAIFNLFFINIFSKCYALFLFSYIDVYDFVTNLHHKFVSIHLQYLRNIMKYRIRNKIN